MLETVLFYLISFGVVLSAIGVIYSRSAIYSVLCLVAAMGLMAGLFVLLKAFLVATILLLVYAGAILVLFLFVLMLIGTREPENDWKGRGPASLMALTLGLTVFYGSFCVIRTIFAVSKPGLVQGTAKPIGLLLFNQYALPFELTSLLLLAAVVSVVVLAKKQAS